MCRSMTPPGQPRAFCALYRRWDRLGEVGNAICYVRSSVRNGCRWVLRHRAAVRRAVVYQRLAAAVLTAKAGRHLNAWPND
jgi:hypothetical protein